MEGDFHGLSIQFSMMSPGTSRKSATLSVTRMERLRMAWAAIMRSKSLPRTLFENKRSTFVIPAKAGIQGPPAPTFTLLWTPAFAGVTKRISYFHTSP